MFGKFKAKIFDYGVSETKSGNPQVFIKLNVQENENSVKQLTWYGSFNGGGKDITLKTLIGAGLQPQHYGQLTNLINGVQSGMLDLNKELEADIQQEPKQDGSGMRTVVQWLNDPATAPQIKKIDEAKNAQFFGSMGFEQDLMRLAGELGIQLNNGGMATMGANPNQQNMNPYANQQQNIGQNMNQQNFQTNGNIQNQNMGQNMNQNMNQGMNQNGQGQTFKAPF